MGDPKKQEFIMQQVGSKLLFCRAGQHFSEVCKIERKSVQNCEEQCAQVRGKVCKSERKSVQKCKMKMLRV